jgi:phage terminase large subunit GpA-like protein
MKKKTADLFAKMLKALEPPPNTTLSQWADSKRQISSGSSKPGQWQTSNTPYLREIMDAISDASNEKVVGMMAAQTGKTQGLILNTIGYYMDYDPSPMLVVQPSLEMAQDFSKNKLVPMLHDTPCLRGKVSDKKRSSSGTILNKQFPGGFLAIVGANSAAGLRSRPIRILFADEVDAYPASAGKEGDPLLLAEKRLSTYWNRKEVIISTPTIKELSRIAVEYENSTKEVWNVPCPQCGEYQPLEWEYVLFDKENPVEIRYVCPKCGGVSGEYEWKERFTEGKYIAEFPERRVRGFHANALASLIGDDWAKIVTGFLTATEEARKGNIEQLKVWTNTVLGQVWDELGETVEEDALFARREKYNCEVPQEVLCITAGIDTQDDRFEVEVVGWGYERENWGIQYRRIPALRDMKEPEVWERLDAFLSQTFTKPDGTKLHILRACIDAGGHYFNEVIRWCRPRIVRGIYPIRGVDGFEKPYIPKPSTNNRDKVPMLNIGVDTGKSLIYQSLGVKEEGANYSHFPKEEERGYGIDYFKGLTAEKKITTYKNGRAVYVWRVKAGHRRNEPLDCRNYAQAALEISGVVLKKPDGGEVRKVQTVAAPKKRRILSGGIK